MSYQKIIRAWKDPAYRASLSDAERQRLPENPAGAIELPDHDARNVHGGLDLVGRSRGDDQFITASWLCNCENISKAMSATSTCCCFSIPQDPRG